MKCFLHLLMVILCLSFVQNETTEPTTTTTNAPTTNVPTTTSIPLTTPVPGPPEPTEGSWNVTDGNITCIRANLKIRFKIPIYNQTVYIVLPPDAESEGSSCNATNNTQILNLSSGNFSLTFVFGQDDGKTFVESITMAVTLSVGKESFSNNSKQFSVTSGNSYRCKSTTSIPMDNIIMEVLDVHIQAFGGEGKDFATAEDCESDDAVSDIIPIVVACALSALIIIVFIAYLVGRRRSRQKGYSSV